ncbi:unnamed protein product [Cuscuta campestris]|uniref:RWP-RK domain-containing protein n=1 Tax=Cuscuta campestris TaxID=132261 RepID=A0A484MZ94_9ASTE|nr:unnamed protein product [Cuscuta campestris]
MKHARSRAFVSFWLFCAMSTAKTYPTMSKRFDVSEQHAGLNDGVWKCVYLFYSHRSQPPLVDFCHEWIPISKNSRQIFEGLDDELNAISELAKNAETEKSKQNLKTEAYSSKILTKQRLGMKSFPDSDDEYNNGKSVHKKRRAAPEDISRIALQDLVKYFNLPITEASRSLKIGLTVLKKKCREFGIPRWPHRKIKSLDRLIVDLREETQQQNDGEDTTMVVSTKKRMVEFERERIEKKPYMDGHTRRNQKKGLDKAFSKEGTKLGLWREQIQIFHFHSICERKDPLYQKCCLTLMIHFRDSAT